MHANGCFVIPVLTIERICDDLAQSSNNNSGGNLKNINVSNANINGP